MALGTLFSSGAHRPCEIMFVTESAWTKNGNRRGQ